METASDKIVPVASPKTGYEYLTAITKITTLIVPAIMKFLRSASVYDGSL